MLVCFSLFRSLKKARYQFLQRLTNSSLIIKLLSTEPGIKVRQLCDFNGFGWVLNTGGKNIATLMHRYKKVALLFLLCLFAKQGAFAQAITYGTSMLTYNVGTTIVAKFPTVTGGTPYVYGQVITFAGSGVSGTTNGTGTGATFSRVAGVVTDAAGNIYVSDNASIRKITPAGVVTNFATGFNFPQQLSIDANGNIYVPEFYANRVSKVTPAGVVSIIAGTGTAGYLDGPVSNALFNHPGATAIDASGNVYVTDAYNSCIRKVTPSGIVSTFAGIDTAGYANGTGTAARFAEPMGIVFDAQGNLYLADKANNVIREITPAAVVSLFAGNRGGALVNGNRLAASFFYPFDVTIDAFGNMYVLDQYYNVVRKITPAGIVSTLAGSGTAGSADGIGTAASFSLPYALTVDGNGNIYVADWGNKEIRKIITVGYSISPSLPPGLAFDPNTGGISGTPTTVTAAQNFTITANTSTGYCKTTVSLAVNTAVQPSTQSYALASWTGKVSSDWGTAGNWNNNVVPSATTNVQIGISPFTNQPTVNNNQQIHNLTFGGRIPVTLTVNSGNTLAVSGQVVQNHASDDSTPITTIIGAGTLAASSILVGDPTTPKLVLTKTTTLISQIANLNVTGNITINSTTANLLTGGIATNNAKFSLQAGVLNIAGQIITSNQIPASCNSFGTATNTPSTIFSIDINSSQNATLILTDSSSVAIANTAYGTVDFYNPISGTGRSIVKYTGANQLVYTNTTPGINTSPAIYEDLTIAGTGIKTAGNTASNNNLNISGNLNVISGLLDLATYAPQTVIGGNFTNHGAVNFGSSTTTINGGSFFNSGGFAAGTGIIQFSGGAQALVDSTQNGTNFNKVSFNNTGTKNIQSGNFNVVVNGVVRLSNSAVLNVVSGAGFTMFADSTGYSYIAPIPSGSNVTGLVNVQQFIQGAPSGIGYHLFTSPVNFTGTLSGDRSYNLRFMQPPNPVNGMLTYGPAGGGFDAVSNSSLYIYREDIANCNSTFNCGNNKPIGKINYSDPNLVGTTQRFTVTNIADTTIYIPVGSSILCYFEGNRVVTTYPFDQQSTTVTHTGTVNQGDINFKDWYRSDHTLTYTNSPSIANAPHNGIQELGNPYPAAINCDNFSSTNSNSSFYGPNMHNGFSVLNTATSQFNAYIPDSTHDKTQVYYGTGIASNIIPPGVGFTATVDASSPNPYAASLTIREGAKFDPEAPAVGGGTTMALAASPLQRNLALATPATAAKSSTVLTTKTASTPVSNAKVSNTALVSKLAIPKKTTVPPDELIRLMLVQDKIENDDILIHFKQGSSSTYKANEDAYDMGGTELATVMLSSYSSDHIPLSINTMPLPAHLAKIALFTDATKSGTYTLRATAIENIFAQYDVHLRDKFNGQVINLRQVNAYTFNIDKNQKLTYGDRFELLIIKKK